MERGAGVENASTADLSSAESGPVEGCGGAGCASDVVKENQSAALTSNIVPEQWCFGASMINLVQANFRPDPSPP